MRLWPSYNVDIYQADPSTPMTWPNNSSHLDQRRSFRHPLKVLCGVQSSNATEHAFMLRDVSQTGFSGSCLASCGAGASLSLDLPPLGLLAARVVWRHGRLLGADFVNALTRWQLQELLAAYDDALLVTAAPNIPQP